MIAYATFAHHDAALVQAVSAKVLHMPGVFDPQAIANTLWALALLDDLSPPVWNCLLVAFVQAERFNSKHDVHCYVYLVLMSLYSAVRITDMLLWAQIMVWPMPAAPCAAAVFDKTLENAVTAKAGFWATYVLIKWMCAGGAVSPKQLCQIYQALLMLQLKSATTQLYVQPAALLQMCQQVGF